MKVLGDGCVGMEMEGGRFSFVINGETYIFAFRGKTAKVKGLQGILYNLKCVEWM